MEWFAPWIFALTLVTDPGPCGMLERLDAQRALAYAVGEVRLLDEVYAPGPSREADRAVLRGYTDRGYVVLGAGMEVSSCRVTAATADAVTLHLTDRLGATWAVSATEWTRLPRDRLTQRVVSLVRTDAGWRVG